MVFYRRERDLDDYLIGTGDRVEIDTPYGTVKGEVTGRGAAGSYLQIQGDDGQQYEGYSSDPGIRKIFPGES